MGAPHVGSPSRVEVCRDLLVPSTWVVGPSPDGDAAGRWAAQILVELGVIRSSDFLRALRPGQLGASMFPAARGPELATLTLLCSAWAVYDDALESTGRPDPAISRALRQGSAPADAPALVRAFARAGEGLRSRSPAWRRRFAATFDATVATVAYEVRLREALARGRPPSVDAYLAWRRVNIGLGAMLPLVEHSLGRQVVPDGSMADWTAACTDVFLAINDHCSRDKDGPGRLDLASSLAAARGWRLDEADRAVVRFHDQAVARVEAEAQRLRHRFAEEPVVLDWMDGVHRLLAGFGAWHRVAPRYAELAA
ncbi:MAG: hypothetical protein KTR31_31600 [Myxococcales bacterium]|nr:hypothetical protein [Myxococcales bacterium]